MEGWEKSPKETEEWCQFLAPARGSQAECDFALVISLSFYRS